ERNQRPAGAAVLPDSRGRGAGGGGVVVRGPEGGLVLAGASAEADGPRDHRRHDHAAGDWEGVEQIGSGIDDEGAGPAVPEEGAGRTAGPVVGVEADGRVEG